MTLENKEKIQSDANSSTITPYSHYPSLSPYKVLIYLGQLFHNEQVNYLEVLIQSRQPMRIIIAHFVVLKQRYKQPKGDLLIAVHQQAPHYEVHTLHVSYTSRTQPTYIPIVE